VPQPARATHVRAVAWLAKRGIHLAAVDRAMFDGDRLLGFSAWVPAAADEDTYWAKLAADLGVHVDDLKRGVAALPAPPLPPRRAKRRREEEEEEERPVQPRVDEPVAPPAAQSAQPSPPLRLLPHGWPAQRNGREALAKMFRLTEAFRLDAPFEVCPPPSWLYGQGS
jgi:hypothetical protein